MFRKTSFGDVVTGTLAGMVGGAVASWVMNQYMTAQQQHAHEQERGTQRTKQRVAGGKGGKGGRQRAKGKAEGGGGESGGDDATVKTAQAISRNLFEHELSDSEKKVAGPAVHYSYGTIVGGLYGGLAEMVPVVGGGFGMPYGIALWLLGDEIAIPALELGPPPTQVPPDKHADFLAAHLVYGMTLDVTRRVMRHVL